MDTYTELIQNMRHHIEYKILGISFEISGHFRQYYTKVTLILCVLIWVGVLRKPPNLQEGAIGFIEADILTNAVDRIVESMQRLLHIYPTFQRSDELESLLT